MEFGRKHSGRRWPSLWICHILWNCVIKGVGIRRPSETNPQTIVDSRKREGTRGHKHTVGANQFENSGCPWVDSVPTADKTVACSRQLWEMAWKVSRKGGSYRRRPSLERLSPNGRCLCPKNWTRLLFLATDKRNRQPRNGGWVNRVLGVSEQKIAAHNLLRRAVGSRQRFGAKPMPTGQH